MRKKRKAREWYACLLCNTLWANKPTARNKGYLCLGKWITVIEVLKPTRTKRKKGK